LPSKLQLRQRLLHLLALVLLLLLLQLQLVLQERLHRCLGFNIAGQAATPAHLLRAPSARHLTHLLPSGRDAAAWWPAAYHGLLLAVLLQLLLV
jgi:hypothetical protein